ncbi:MAG: serine O-acetyltransferase, partial [Rhizobacter sp.]
MFQRLREDIACILERDPAAHSAWTVLTCYPGLHAIVMHRWANACWRRGFRWAGRFISHLGRFFTGIEIHPGFSKAVDNPVLHVDRLGGFYDNNRPNGTRWTLTGFTAAGGAVALERLSGNAQFTVTPEQNRFARATTGTFGGTGSSECLSTSNGTACGSVRFNGTGITRLTFAVEMAGDRGAGDEL